jgi:hypothetical protein
MKPRLTVVTLGVDDLERALAFYRDGLGLATNGIVGTEFEYGAVVFFELQGGLIPATRSGVATRAISGPGRPSVGGSVESAAGPAGLMERGRKQVSIRALEA